MKQFIVTAKRTEFISKVVTAETQEEAEQLAYETDGWRFDNYGDIEHDSTEEA